MPSRRGHPLVKALGGVVVLMIVAFAAGAAGVRVVQDMVTENGKSRIELFADGTDHPTIVTLGDPKAKISVALPSTPHTGHEAMTFLGAVTQVNRGISPAGDASVQILWFRVPAAMARNPEATFAIIASSQANNLGGKSPLEARVVSTGTTAMYDFRVHPTGSVAGGSDYSVRILLRGNMVYVVRVEAKKGGPQALLKVANSIRWL
jgi:hypothetical protein